MLTRYALRVLHRHRAIVDQCQRRHLLPTAAIARPFPPTAGHTARRRRYSSISSVDVAERTKRLLDAKAESGLTYDDLSSALGVTNTYAAQLLLGQAKLSNDTARKLQEALPSASAEDIREMQNAYPMRSFDEEILKEPNVYRTYEAVTHYGEAIKNIINEQCGDGQ